MDGKNTKKLSLASLRWTRLHQLLHDNRGVRYFAVAIGLLIASGFSVLIWIWQQPVAQLPIVYSEQQKKPEAPKIYSPLTGLEVGDEALTKRPITAIMIENSPDARPQSGLKDAGIVYEAIAEGGITRFIALYQEARPGLIGPVRSVRPYYVEWASAYDPAVAHVGGSARALQMIRSGNYGVDLDQFFNAGTYWRANDRYAPHNVYTSFDRLDALNAAKGKAGSNFTPLPRKDDNKSKTPNATYINMPVSSGAYAVEYDYDSASNTYVRKEGGAPHVDREGGQLTPKVVVAIEVNMSLEFEDGYREQITTTGSGRAWVFQDGTVQEATWQRPDVKSQLSLTGADGKPISLNRGQTWISAMTNGRVPSWR
jgi:hypothetical protein